ncbi:MAG TPA: FKBP-type peptidyl-prolyl cis-trans isomerase [bacterium]|nr:FKBP-type peptidyl-prolyl cis-trans isomerase [bacterium]
MGSAEKKEKDDLKKPEARLSYVLGQDVGSSLKNLNAKVDWEWFLRGVKDAFEGKESLVGAAEASQMKQELFKKMQEASVRARAAEGEKNRTEGLKFLEENAKKPGVITTPSGLQYQVLKEGSGPSPLLTDRVKVNYRGTLLNGTEFDSSYRRGQPAVFPLSGVIKGWQEGLLLMKTGSVYRFFIPPQLAYGEKGAGQVIGPNAVLIFEVELLEIVK